MVDVITGILGAVGLGGALGALSAYLGWSDNGSPFDVTKFIKGIVTGAIAGIITVSLAFDAIQASLADPTGVAFLKIIIVVGLSIIGIDMGTSKVAGIISARSRAKEEKVESK